MRLNTNEREVLERKKSDPSIKIEPKRFSRGGPRRSAKREYIESCGFNYHTIMARLRRNPDLSVEEAMATPTRTPREAAMHALDHAIKKRKERASGCP